MVKLDALLTGAEPIVRERTQKSFGLDELRISQYAYEKAFDYARLAVKLRGQSVEVGGFLTVPVDSQDRIARDAYLTRDQEVSVVDYKLNAADVARASKELEQNGQRAIGWWHSHGRAQSFHSDIDKKNQMVMLNQIAPSNYVTTPEEKTYGGLQSRIDGDELVFWDSQSESRQFRLKLKEADPSIVAESLRVLDKKRIGFAYSFVVNWNRWVSNRVPYCEIATRDLCTGCMEAKDTSAKTDFKIFNYEEQRASDEQLIDELKDRVPIFKEAQRRKSFFLPSVFEEKRDNGTLTKPIVPSHYGSTAIPVIYDTADAPYFGFDTAKQIGGKDGI